MQLNVLKLHEHENILLSSIKIDSVKVVAIARFLLAPNPPKSSGSSDYGDELILAGLISKLYSISKYQKHKLLVVPLEC